ncbi:MAG: hypothetical protein COA58_03940 [Bacteroidetes bacterium]|nr:MAG: hypothetical protein COA58_03940 [Bacteroidota bacterium]
MKQYHYSRKTRQLRNSVVELDKTIAESHGTLNDKIKSLIVKIKHLIAELQSHLGILKLKHILGATAVFFGLNVNAQNFDKPVQNPFGITNTYQLAMPTAVDLDGDGDFDLMVGEYYGNYVYFENTGTKSNPQFAGPSKNPFGLVANGGYFGAPTFTDLDNDGDQDMLTGGYYGAQVYYENTGTSLVPSFATPVTNPFGLDSTEEYSIPKFVDIDGDGDQDLMISEYYGNLVYYKNTGTKSSPQFTKSGTNMFGIVIPAQTYVAFPEFADLDDDGDLDLLLGQYDGALAYFENTGTATNPAFANHVINPFDLDSAYYFAAPAFVDIDDDGDLDLLVGEYYGNIQFYKNTQLVSSINRWQLDNIEVSIYPNPAQDFISIDTKFKSNKISILNAQGQLVLQSLDSPQTKIDISALLRGQYYIKLENEDGNVASTSFVKL